MRSLKPRELIVNKNELEDIQLEMQAIRYCREKHKELLANDNNLINYLNMPTKQYEILNLEVYGGKTFLLKASDLPIGDEREVYFSFDIANKIYEYLIDIKDISFNENPEVKDLYIQDILKIENEIEKLKQEDSKMYIEAMQIYETISKTTLFTDYRNLYKDRQNLIQKNNELKAKYNDSIKDLSNKLRTALNRIETLQAPRTFWEKFKDLFHNDTKTLLLSEKRGE